ncbi:putative bifunctional diguanylate cyclase/phosphodiesterase [Methylovirgula ligni]|uniref:putative bifunctional diguanylate cyclase/phosphodiesterase n=1 Tax=Methylovirgula ligni TaxID=569860 RepID=UPI001012A040|nr:EAL domain-containing protein [Methylovirgula ligni]
MAADILRDSNCTTGSVEFDKPAGAAPLAAVEIHRSGAAIRAQLLQQLQKEILEAIATGWPLARIIVLLCQRAETLSPNAICSVLRVDAEANCLLPLAGPSLPDEIVKLTSHVAIAPNTGSCGTAAYRGEPVEVTDIASDPLWKDYKDLFLPHGLRACWSSPIKGRDGKVLGTFAFYYREPRGPDMLDRQIVAACINLCAIALEHDRAQSRILKLAYRDQQTDLPNRAAFQQRACEILEKLPASGGKSLAVHYIDLDDFKGVNDTLGHAVGDQLLSAVAARLRTVCQNGEFVARLGGDEFAVLQFPVAKLREIERLAQKLLSCFARPFEVEERTITTSASIGIARAPTDSNDFSNLLRRADVALYRAKGAGRARYCLFDEEMGRRMLARRAMEKDLRQALARGEITLHFQPIVDLATGRTICFEALARWYEPSRGLVPPSEFIPIAEEIGIIVEFGNWFLRRACREAARWPADIRIAVNLSPLQLSRADFIQQVEAALAESGLPPERLELEITESVPLVANQAMREVLCALKSRGISIALDDFGTGYSSLSYLRSFPFDRLKIDHSFVREIPGHGQTMAIVKAVLDLARSVNVRTTAEGIEIEPQRIWLQAQGCSEGQGYLFNRPMPAEKVAEFLAGECTISQRQPHVATPPRLKKSASA